jgi:hypothetical protein
MVNSVSALACACWHAEVLLARDGHSLLYGPDGRPARRASNRGDGRRAVLEWADPPSAQAVSGPYVVAFSDAGAEARLLQPLATADLWQHLALSLPGGAAALVLAPSAAPDGSVFLASRASGAIKRVRGWDARAPCGYSKN